MSYSDQLLQAIESYLNGKATAEEKQLVNDWYHSFDDGEVNVDTADMNYGEVVESRLRERIGASIGLSVKRRQRLWPRIAGTSRGKLGTRRVWLASAAAVAAITLGVWLYYASSIGGRHPEPSLSSRASRDLNDIKPGKNTATLILANGKTILLSDAKTGVVIGGDKFVYNDGAEIPDQVRHDEVQMLTASTPRGGQYQVVLPDGTKVWLNADSKLSFPSQFSGKERKVMLEGEAYFVVVHNAKQPFRVESRGQVVEDIGTEFNISAYADESSVKTTLVEGSASVSSLRDRNDVVLKPNQQATLTANSEIQVKTVDPAEAAAWKQGKFVFRRETLESILRKVGRWYDVQILNQDADLKATYSANISRGEKVSQILGLLEKTNTVRFEIRGRQIIVKKFNQ